MFQWFFHGQKSFFFWFQKSRKSGNISIFSDFRPFQAKDVKKTTFWTLFCDAPSPVTAWFLPTLQAFLAMKKRTRRTVILFLPAPFRDEILGHETNFSDLKSVHFFEMRLPRPHSSAQKNLTRTTVKRHLDSPNHCHRPLSDEPKTPPDDMKKSGSDAPWLISHDSHLAGLACARKHKIRAVACYWISCRRKRAVTEVVDSATCSGVPMATTWPPPRPPSGPMSMI